MFKVRTLGTQFSEDNNLRFGTSTRDFNLMQYTGFQDKQGKEIYEGDILYDGKGCYRIVHFGILRGAWFAGYLRLTRILVATLEVSGNRWENPELLETENE